MAILARASLGLALALTLAAQGCEPDGDGNSSGDAGRGDGAGDAAGDSSDGDGEVSDVDGEIGDGAVQPENDGEVTNPDASSAQDGGPGPDGDDGGQPADAGSMDAMSQDAAVGSDAGLDATSGDSASESDGAADAGQNDAASAPETGVDPLTCSYPCAAGFKLVSGRCVPIPDPNYGCGATGSSACATSHAVAECANGSCSGTACHAGWGNCNGDAADGCETSLTTLQNCGGCGTTCAVGQKCSPTGCVAACSPPLTACGEACVNLSTSADHCGSCSTVCTAPSLLARPVCQAGQCAATCDNGSSATSNGSCRACTAACAGTGYDLPSCRLGGSCDECEAGFKRCGANCVPILHDAANCGDCDALCLEGTKACQAGSCVDASTLLFASSPANIYDMAADGGYVYWSAADGVLRRARASDGNVETVTSGLVDARRIAIDATHVYIAMRLGGGIMRVLKAGGTAEVVASAVLPELLALDDSQVYWTSNSDASINTAPKSGGSAAFIANVKDAADGTGWATGLAVDATHIYYTVDGLDGILRKLTKAGVRVASYPLYRGGSVVVTDDRVYGVSQSVRVFTKALEPLFELFGADDLNMLVMDDTHLFFGTTRIYKGRKCGGNHVMLNTGTLVQSGSNRRVIAVDATSLYLAGGQVIVKLRK